MARFGMITGMFGLSPASLQQSLAELDQRQHTLDNQFQNEKSRLESSHAQLQAGLSDVTAENLTAPIREAFDEASADIQNLALQENAIAQEEVRAIEQNNPESRVGARAAQREKIRSSIRRDLAATSAQTMLNFGTALTSALQQGTSLEMQARTQVNQSAQNISTILADYLKTQNAFMLGNAGLKADLLKKMGSGLRGARTTPSQKRQVREVSKGSRGQGPRSVPNFSTGQTLSATPFGDRR